jgi:hypothetical protein
MNHKTFLAASCIAIILTGCAGVGVITTDDPLTKLNDAGYLYERQNRPLIAERLIFEAREIYIKENNQFGLASANRQYGYFLASQSVTNWEKVYRENGFRDKSITFDNRNIKSKEYLTIALANYKVAESQAKNKSEYDTIANINYNMANIYYTLENIASSCASLDNTLVAFNENIKRNPTAQPAMPSGYSSFAEFIKDEKKTYKCSTAL